MVAFIWKLASPALDKGQQLGTSPSTRTIGDETERPNTPKKTGKRKGIDYFEENIDEKLQQVPMIFYTGQISTANNPDFLTTDEIAWLKERIAPAHKESKRLEATQVKVERDDKSRAVFTLAPYPEQGRVIRQQLFTDILDKLGENRGQLLNRVLDSPHGIFSGFGKYSQKIWLGKILPIEIPPGAPPSAADQPVMSREFFDANGESMGRRSWGFPGLKDYMENRKMPPELEELKHILTSNGQDGWGMIPK